MKKNRVHWRDFVGTTVHKDLQKMLRQAGFHLAIKLDDQKIATDVFIKTFPL